ncbi:sigma 54-interacting transcriptional regulator [archaeon]|nr:sigma 54-interacting transcriptional regulator [archaeon]
MTTDFIGESKEICAVNKDIEMYGPTDLTILITGETGTGKELVANLLFENSLKENSEILITKNCATIREELAESEFFGHIKGSFTGADEIREGIFEKAEKGTIFLDEIHHLSNPILAKLLRVAEEKPFNRIGCNEDRYSGARLILAGSPSENSIGNIPEMPKEFGYRLKKIIELPPLRERGRDISLLTHHFVDKFEKKYNKEIKINEGDFNRLIKYNWPGNVRQMENAIERYAISGKLNFQEFYASGTEGNGNFLSLEDIANQFYKKCRTEGINMGKEGKLAKKMIESQLFTYLLEENNGNRSKVAEILGINTRTISNRLKN